MSGGTVMALEELLAHIEARAREEVERALARGRAEAARVRAEAEELRSAARRAHRAREEARLREEAEPALAGARLEARRRLSEARRRFAARVFAKLEARLPEATARPSYRASIRTRIESSLGFAFGRPARVRAAPELASLLREGLALGLDVSVEPDPSLATGFELETLDGSLVVVGTLAAELEATRKELEVELFRLWEAEREAHVG